MPLVVRSLDARLPANGPSFRVYTAGSTRGLPSTAVPRDIAVGSGGVIWFTDNATPAIGEIDSDGQIKEFAKGLASGSQPYAIVAGPDGNMWFSDGMGAIGRVTTSGVISEFTSARLKADPPAALTVDGSNVWTIATGTRSSFLVRVALDGTTAAVEIPKELIPDGSLQADADGNLWFFASLANHDVVLAKFTNHKTFVEYHTGLTTKGEPCCPNLSPNHIAIGSDGHPWFTTPYFGLPKSPARVVGTFEPGHGATFYDIDLDGIAYPVYPSGIVTSGSDLWYSGSDPIGFNGALWRMTTNGKQAAYPIPYDPAGLAVANATTIWFTSQAQGRAPQIVEATFAKR